MNDIRLFPPQRYGSGFIPEEDLEPGENEFRYRDRQLAGTGKDPASFRRLSTRELETLVKNDNSCDDWSRFLVSDPFTPELITNSSFFGLVRIGKLEELVLEHHDLYIRTGISNSRLIAVDVGDNCAIHDCAYLAHYIVGDTCVLIRNDEIHVSNHAKFGNGIVMEKESEANRIELDIMNESGGRAVLPFDGMLCADAYLWARYRDRPKLMKAIREMTESRFVCRRGLYGMVGRASVLKSNKVIKDVLFGESVYVKGANKLKNLTVNSSESARTQIGEGVEIVNGIIGYGCRIFYGCKAVRFVMCDNSALKYGARLIHSVLGENSTVSCCELLNNLIFPAHEQHHNTSFLIASLIKGQSNMAAGATVGSNHNSRAPDGEIVAGRGFWPGLCVSLKHSSRFASFCLMSKGDYPFELDVRLPFCLVTVERKLDRLVLLPGYWWTHNMYALMRNESKFLARDRRPAKLQRFEQSPFGPDTANEMLEAVTLLELWTGRADVLADGGDPWTCTDAELESRGKAILDAGGPGPDFEVFAGGAENSSRPVLVANPKRGRNAYLEMLVWYAGTAILEYAFRGETPLMDIEALERELGTGNEPGSAAPDETAGREEAPVRVGGWENLGGQLVPVDSLESILARMERREITDWNELHDQYALLGERYPADKARHAWSVFAYLVRNGHAAAGLSRLLASVRDLSYTVERRVLESREKDYTNSFRRATFRSPGEMRAVVGEAGSNPFVRTLAGTMETLRSRIDTLGAPR